MIDNGLKIRIKGIPFEKDDFTEFQLLKRNPKKKKQSTIIYGKNGAGKTSISNAIDELKMDLMNRCFISEFVDDDNNIINLDFLKQVYVFNEKFIDDKIRFTTTDGLDAIVLLGNELIDENEIDELKKVINEEREKIKKIDLTVYEDDNNHDNPAFIMSKIINTLKMDGNWASKQQKINRIQRKASVNEQTVYNIKDNHSKKISVDEYDKLLGHYLRINANDEKYKYVFKIPLDKFDENNFNSLMSKKLEIVNSDEMSRRILNTLEEHSEERTNEITKVFSSNIEYCPYCFRPIDINEKELVINKIKSALSKESDEFIVELEKIKLSPYEVKELPSFIADSIKSEYILTCRNYNDCVTYINDFINKKKLNLYTSLTSSLANDYISSYKMLISVIGKINVEISSYNTLIDEQEKMKNNLKDYCNYLSWESIKGLYEEYEQKSKIMIENKKMFNEIIMKINNLEEKLEDLISKKRNEKDAVIEINKCLSFIFLTDNRLNLSLQDNHYVVHSNGMPIPLKKLSTGERNIISLCYFFCSIGEGKNTKERYDDEYLIFIDDPISSFDHDNKIGIYSFLRSEINNFKESNFIFLTHSYEVGYNLAKVFNDIYGNGNSNGKNVQHITNYLEIRECEVINSELNLVKGKNQYNVLINEIFKYAGGDESQINDFTIGNSVRRVLEMFTTFEYNVGFERIIDKIDDKKKINRILKNYMSRILLNNESHLMLSAYAFDEVDRFEMFSSEEKHKVAKLALIMLKVLNAKHISAYLKETELNILEQWETEIENGIV